MSNFKNLKLNYLVISLFIITFVFLILKHFEIAISGSLFYYSWQPAKNTINQVIHNTPNFWAYVQTIAVLGMLITVITLYYVEQRWYLVIGWGWFFIFSDLLIFVTSAFNGLWPLYYLIIVAIGILMLIFRYWYLDGWLPTMKAMSLMVFFFLFFTSSLILYMGYILYGPHIKVMIPGTPFNMHYYPFIEVYKYYYPSYSRLFFFSIIPQTNFDFLSSQYTGIFTINDLPNKIAQILHKVLEPSLAYYAGDKCVFPWPMNTNTLLGKHFSENYINLLISQNHIFPVIHHKVDFYNHILPRYNRLHYNLIPFKKFMQNEQALKLLFLSSQPFQSYNSFVILVGLTTHSSIHDMVQVTPYTAEMLFAASQYAITGEISLYHWLGIANIVKPSMLFYSHIYGTVLYDYYSRLFFWKMFIYSGVAITLIHLIQPSYIKFNNIWLSIKKQKFN